MSAKLRHNEDEAWAAALTASSKTDIRAVTDLLHELHVRQYDLVMQNEALGKVQLDLEKSRNRYAELYDFAPIGYITLTGKGIVREANHTAAALLGVDRTTLYQQSFSRFINPDSLDQWNIHLAALQRHGAIQRCELLIQRENNTLFSARLESTRAVMAGDDVLIHTTIVDISKHKQTDDLVANVLDSIDEGIIIINRDFRIVFANKVFADTIGSPVDEIIGHHCYKISHRIDKPCYLAGEECPLKHVFDTGEPSTVIQTQYSATGGPIYMEARAFPLQKNEKNEVQTVVKIVVDITEKKTHEAEIHQLAFYDPLTRLPNRRLLLDRLKQAFIASSRTGDYGALLFLDLDNFKTLNDTRGHHIGDLLLIAAAERLQALVREGDTVSRQGGDEFVVLLENMSQVEKVAVSQAAHVAEKIRTSLSKPYKLNGFEHHSTTSIGICLFRGHEVPEEELFKHADIAMYQAKHGGRNTLSFFDPVMQAALETSSALEADLRQAIQKGQFWLHYQPQTDGEQGVVGAEALLRWTHPERGKVSPASFIPLAEENGLILPIGRWVLKEACGKLRNWADSPTANGLWLAVNISARQFRQSDFVEEVRQIIKETGADPTRLKLELSENLVLKGVTDINVKMQELKAMGVGFFMDDFGSGCSSLSQLKRLPFEQLKIDQSFIRDLDSDPHDTAIIETIIAMGRPLGFNVIAKGVETKQQLAFLESHGCHAYQGYLFSRPVPAAEFERLLVAGFGEERG